MLLEVVLAKTVMLVIATCKWVLTAIQANEVVGQDENKGRGCIVSCSIVQSLRNTGNVMS